MPTRAGVAVEGRHRLPAVARLDARSRLVAPTRSPVLAIASATLSKNSLAIRFETLVSIRWPTPPTMPPTTASAS